MSNVLINYPKFKAFTTAGAPAAGYKVYTYAVGTTTAQATYSERTLTSANTNPIILDSAGECIIYTGNVVKLVLKTDADVTVWTFDYLAEQADALTQGTVTPVTAHNQYVVASSPVLTALSENLMLVFTPDVTNVTTLTSNVFTGSGINDCVEGGVYIGTTAGSTYQVVIDGATEAAPGACTDTVSLVAGSCTAGAHLVKITFVTAHGETLPGTASGGWTSAGSDTCDLTAIPTGSAQVTSRKVYMTEAAGADYYYVGEVAGNTTTTYTIDIDDVTLAAAAAAPTADGTSDGDTFKWRKDTGSYTTGVAITTNAQTLGEGVTVTFSTATGHTLAEYWTITVETPARINLDALGNLLVYKNEGGAMTALDGADMIANYPAQLILNAALNAWVLINPATPTFSVTTIEAIRYRKTKAGNYTMDANDEGYEISFTATATFTLLTAPEFSSRFIYVRNSSTDGIVTLDAGASYVIRGNGTRYYYLGIGECVQIQSNGVDWHVLTTTAWPVLLGSDTLAADATSTLSGLHPGFTYKLYYELTPSANSRISIRFSGDTAANYVGITTWVDDAAATNKDSTLTTSIMLAYVTASSFVKGECTFRTLSGDDTNTSVLGSAYGTSTAGMSTYLCGGVHNGAGNLSSVTLINDAGGTFTGKIELYKVS